MKRRKLLGLALVSTLGLGLLAANSGAQEKRLKEQLVGTWTMTSNVNTAANGAKSDVWGPNPKGQLIFGSDGRFSFISMRPDLPKFGTNNRATGTAEENKAVIQGSIAYFGTFSVSEADTSFTLNIETATFPNWSGALQTRVFSLAGDDLSYSVAGASTGGSNELKFKRVK